MLTSSRRAVSASGVFVELSGAVAVVTGASSGIGEATAIAFGKLGARVVLVARRKDRLDDLAARIEGAGGKALALRCDVTDHEQVATLPRVVEEAFGPCDVLVNNAGVAGRGRFEELEYEDIDAIVRVNVTSVMFGTRAFLPGMLRRGRGHVVNVASLAGRFAAPGAAVYSATKHAVVAFSEAMNYETEGERVRVTALNPAFVPTEGFPQEGRPSALMLSVDDVAQVIAKIVREEIAPEYSIPRWAPPLQAFRVLTPPLYRWGVRKMRNAGSRAARSDP